MAPITFLEWIDEGKGTCTCIGSLNNPLYEKDYADIIKRHMTARTPIGLLPIENIEPRMTQEHNNIYVETYFVKVKLPANAA